MACTVRVQRKKLRYRLNHDGREWSGGTKLNETAKNRERVEARAVLISEDIERLALKDWYLKMVSKRLGT